MADQTIAIENLDELANVTHKCTATDKLTDILVQLGRLDQSFMNMAAANQELSARFEEQCREMRQFMNQGHVCQHAAQIARNTNAIEVLEKERQKKIGSDYWVEKFIDSLKYLLLFVMGMFITFILTGGHLT